MHRLGNEWAIHHDFLFLGQIEWFAPMLRDIANAASGSEMDLRFSIFVTCPCDGEEVGEEAVQGIPKCDLRSGERPSMYGMLQDVAGPRGDSSGGGVVVCASGPGSLTTEVENAVARFGAVRGAEVGGVAVHVEQFTL